MFTLQTGLSSDHRTSVGEPLGTESRQPLRTDAVAARRTTGRRHRTCGLTTATHRSRRVSVDSSRHRLVGVNECL